MPRIRQQNPITPLFKTIALSATLIGLSAIVAGVTFVYLNATGTATLRIFGIELHTDSTGFACVAVGGIVVILTMRSLIRTAPNIS
jgi:hypothetical protein